MASRHDATLQQDGTLTVTGKCPISGKEWRLEGLEVDAYNSWRAGEYVQVAFPRLTAGQRELLISGMIEEEFDKLTEYEEEDQESDNEPLEDDHEKLTRRLDEIYEEGYE